MKADAIRFKVALKVELSEFYGYFPKSSFCYN